MSSTDIVQRTPEQQLVAQVRSDQFKEQVAMALPPSVTPERFVRIATTAIITNPDIAKLEHTSILRAFVQCAADGLMPDGKEAAITPRKGKAVYVPMIGGFRKKAAEHGWTLRTAVVYANDEFDHAVVDGEEVITHRPVRPGAERGELIASYAIAKHRDGRRVLTVLHPDDIAKRRKSSAYDAVWNEHPAAMWEKSAGRDIFGQLGLAEGDSAIQRMLAADDLAHGDAAAALYGPSETPAELTAGRTTDDASTTQDTSTTADVAGGHQQAEPAATVTPSAAGSAPDPDPDFADADDELVAAAKEAAGFVVPFGTTWKGKTLADVHAAGETGRQWFAKMLEKLDAARYPDFRTAVFAFARVYLPEEFAAALAREEAQAA